MDWRHYVIAILTVLASVCIVYVKYKTGGMQYGETCQTDTDCWSSDRGVQCLQDGTSHKCLCQTDEFLDKEASVCRKKIHFMGDCQAETDQCATEGAVCRPVGSLRQHRCACETDNEYFNADLQQCRKKIHFMGDCQTETDHCATEGAVCRPVGSFRQLRCACETDTEYFNADLQQCRKKIVHGERCPNREDVCLVDGASCQYGSNKCLCDHNHFLDAESAVCRRMQYIENGHWKQSGNPTENMGEKWTMSCKDGYYVDGCAVIRNYQGKWNKDIPQCLSKTAYWAKWGAISTVACVTSIYAAPVGLAYLGFTAAGITGGSMAASMMSYAAILKGGGVVAGSTVAMLQSAGVLGFSTAATAAIGGAGSATAAATQFLLWNAEGCEEV